MRYKDEGDAVFAYCCAVDKDMSPVVTYEYDAWGIAIGQITKDQNFESYLSILHSTTSVPFPSTLLYRTFR